jgi:hypothetical protein
MFIILIIMDFAYFKKQFQGPQAALKKSMEDILQKETEFER